jgi:hypothetical protein
MSCRIFSAVFLFGVVAVAQEARLTPVAAVIGTWRLVSLERTVQGQAPIQPIGKDVTGRLLYETNGRMAVILGRRDGPKFAAAPGAASGTPDEIRAAFEGFIAYYGSYSLDEQKKQVTHNIEFCSLPNWSGTTQTRMFDLQGDHLILRNKLIVEGKAVEDRLVWERVK